VLYATTLGAKLTDVVSNNADQASTSREGMQLAAQVLISILTHTQWLNINSINPFINVIFQPPY